MDGTDSTQMESREKVLGKLTGLHKGEEIVYSGCVINCTFQQRRLLEGKSTQNVATLSKLIEAAQDSGDEAMRKGEPKRDTPRDRR